MTINIRSAAQNDLEAVARVEATCFPTAEAATKEQFAERLEHYGNHFKLLFKDDRLIAFIDGFVTDEKDLHDIMYEKADLHNEQGKWQMIFGLNCCPEERRQGYAAELINAFIEQARQEKRFGLVLTCKDPLVDYYSRFGFVDEGISTASTHGNVVWHQMRLRF